MVGHLDPQSDGLLDQLVEEPPRKGKPQQCIGWSERPAAVLATHLQDLQGQAPTRTTQHPEPPALTDQGRAVAARAMQLVPMGQQPPKLDVPEPLTVAPGKFLIVKGSQMNKQPVDNVPGAGNNLLREGKLSWEHLDTSFRVWAKSLKAYQMLSTFSKNR